jgi:hypothetical protein
MSKMYYNCPCGYTGEVYYSAGPNPSHWNCIKCSNKIPGKELFLETDSEKQNELLRKHTT